MKPKVLIIAERFPPEPFISGEIASHFSAEGAEVSVVTQVPSYPMDALYPDFSRNISTSYMTGDGVTVYRFPTILGYKRSKTKKILNYINFVLRASMLAMRVYKSGMHVFVYHTGPLTQAFPVLFLRLRGLRSATIWTQDVWPDTLFNYGIPETGLFGTLARWLSRFLYSSFTDVAVTSPGFLPVVRHYAKRCRNFAFVPQWVPNAFTEQREATIQLAGDGTRFIFTGAIGSMQNLEKVILAFSGLDPKQTHFYIVGDGSRRATLQKFVQDNRISNVTFLGHQPQNQIKSLIEQCDFSILSLVSDRVVARTIPAKFQAYLDAGRPIISIASGEVARLVATYNLGLCADPDDIISIKDTLKLACDSTTELRNLWGKNIVNISSTLFNRERSLNQLFELTFTNL